MRTERYIALALPQTAADDAEWHVTAFITPKLDTDEDDAVLAGFPLFADWARIVDETAVFTLWDQNGPMKTERIASTTDAGAWNAAFPLDLAVATNTVPDWTGREHRTYPAATSAVLSKALNLQAALMPLEQAPRPSEHPLFAGFAALGIAPLLRVPSPSRVDDDSDRAQQPSPREFSEAKLRKVLDAGPDAIGRLRKQMVAVLPRVEGRSELVVDTTLAVLAAFRQAERYFEPETAPDTSIAAPDPLAEPPRRLPEVEAEFHKRVSATGDDPALRRALRLDVRLKADPARLKKSTWLAVVVALDGDISLGRFPRTAVAHPDADTIIVAARDSDTTRADGALTLGESPYAVTDVDVDGSSLKQNNYVVGFVRTIAAERNGDDVTAAPPALRAPGLVVTRAGRSDAAHASLADQRALQTALQPETPVEEAPLLYADQVTRGMRIEVWDDTVKRWASLHARRSTTRIEGFADTIADDEFNEGVLQGTAAHSVPPPAADGAPATVPDESRAIRIHETVFGWEGWSLSAPRPGRTITDATVPDPDTPTGYRQTESMVDDPSLSDPRTPPHPFRTTHRAADGTLPRLRYGRSYSFRAWTVDLAGQSRAHELNPQPLPPRDLTAALASAAVGRFTRRQAKEASLSAVAEVGGLQEALQTAASTRLGVIRAEQAPVDIADLPPNLRAAVSAIAAASLRPDVSASALPTQAARTSAAWEALADGSGALDVSPALTEVSDRLDLVASHLGAVLGTAKPPSGAGAGAALRTITPLFPFLRWDPVPPPAIVPYAEFTEGESLRTIAIRTGIAIDPVAGEPSTLEGEAYFDDVQARHPEIDLTRYRTAGRRHIAPPRIAQSGAELHGRFDRALTAPGVSRDDARRLVLAWSLRENGSFAHRFVVDLADPLGGGLEQTGIRLVTEASADPATARTLDELQPGTPPALGNAPGPGQYVVHGADRLLLPYLPDPLADGLSVTFVDAGFTLPLPFPHRSEGFTTRYPGAWPERQPLLLRLASGGPGATLEGHVLTLTLPPGERAKVRLSSSLDRELAPHMALWRLLALSPASRADLADEVVDGRIWSLTPSDGAVFVNATPRPVRRPEAIDRPFVARSYARTDAMLFATFTAHGASTDNLTLEATWTDDIDDPADAGPGRSPGAATALSTQVAPWETIVPFLDEPVDWDVAELGRVRGHLGRHEFPDTRHREVTYRLRAQTRYREYFPPALRDAPLLPPANPGDPEQRPTMPGTAALPDGSDAAVDDGQSLVSRPFTVHVDNTSVPGVPLVHSVLPLLRWERTPEPGQPAARRHTRRSGVRIRLERPWFDTGSGELLGVLLDPGRPVKLIDAPEWHSQWGADPIWIGTPVPRRSIDTGQLDHRLRWQHDDDRPARPGRPVTGPRELTLPPPPAGLVPSEGTPQPEDRRVEVVGYRPEYDAERRLWFVDVAFDADEQFWPFVRLAVARYQPYSVNGAHLSQPVRLDFAQLMPTRTSSVSRTDERTARVVVGGPVLLRGLDRLAGQGRFRPTDAERFDRDRVVTASLQFRAVATDGDLAWETRATRELPRRYLEDARFTCEGELVADRDVPFRTPQDTDEGSSWRVLIEEWESFPADPATGHPDAGGQLTRERRLIFADEVFL